MKHSPGRKERRQEKRLASYGARTPNMRPTKRLRRKKHGIPEHTFRLEAGLPL